MADGAGVGYYEGGGNLMSLLLRVECREGGQNGDIQNVRRTNLRSYGGLVVHVCQESTNPRKGERGRNRSKLFKACNYVCIMRSKKAEPCSYEGISPPCCCSHSTESGIMLERKKILQRNPDLLASPYGQRCVTGACFLRAQSSFSTTHF